MAKYKTFKEWLQNEIPDSLEDLVEHGVDSNYPGLTYYKDTNDLYDEYHDEIWDNLHEDAEAMGHKNIMEMISNFGLAGDIGGDEQFKNALVWYLAEKYARELTEDEEE